MSTSIAQSCETCIDAHLLSRLEDLRRLWTAYCDGAESVRDIRAFT